MSKDNAEIIAKLDSLADAVSRGFSGIELRLARIEARLDAQDRRLDDQSRIMAALIPNKIAAIAGNS